MHRVAAREKLELLGEVVAEQRGLGDLGRVHARVLDDAVAGARERLRGALDVHDELGVAAPARRARAGHAADAALPGGNGLAFDWRLLVVFRMTFTTTE